MDTFGILWAVWGALFAVIEGAALYRDHTDPGSAGTLSEHLRKWFSVKTKLGRTAWLVVSGVFFVVWFIPHIAFGPHVF